MHSGVVSLHVAESVWKRTRVQFGKGICLYLERRSCMFLPYTFRKVITVAAFHLTFTLWIKRAKCKKLDKTKEQKTTKLQTLTHQQLVPT